MILDSQRIKNISQELLYTNTYMQNIADKSDIQNIDYTTNIKDTIKLKDKDSFEYEIGKKRDGDNCYIYSIDKDGENKLTNPNTTYISKLSFVTIPFVQAPEDKSQNPSQIKDIYSHGFWMMTEMTAKNTDTTKPIYTQTFFSVRSY